MHLRWPLRAVWLWLAGALMNKVTKLANGGLFPEWAPGDHPGYINAAEARLAWLGDWLPAGDYWLSPGDLLIFAGLILLVGSLAALVAQGVRTGRWLEPVGDRA